MRKTEFGEPHAINNPFPLWQMITDTEHNLYQALSTGDKASIKHCAELLRDLMNTVLEQIKK